MLVLDTDHLVELDRASPEGLVLQERLEAATEDGATLLSRNLRDFQQVPGLTVEDWL
jgi:predicted nucleic acid-binding protein